MALYRGPVNLHEDPTYRRFVPTRGFVAHNLRRNNPQLADTVEGLSDAEWMRIVQDAPPEEKVFRPDRGYDDATYHLTGSSDYETVYLSSEERRRFLKRDPPAWEQVAAYNQAAQAHASPLLAIPRSNFYRLIKEMVDLCTLIHGGERRPYKIRQRVYTHRAHPGKEFKEVQVCALEDRPVYKITRRAFDVIQVAAEAYIIDFLRKANAVALHSRRQTVAAHDLQFLRMINGPNAWSAEPQRSRVQEVLMDNFYLHRGQENWLAQVLKDRLQKPEKQKRPSNSGDATGTTASAAGAAPKPPPGSPKPGAGGGGPAAAKRPSLSTAVPPPPSSPSPRKQQTPTRPALPKPSPKGQAAVRQPPAQPPQPSPAKPSPKRQAVAKRPGRPPGPEAKRRRK